MNLGTAHFCWAKDGECVHGETLSIEVIGTVNQVVERFGARTRWSDFNCRSSIVYDVPSARNGDKSRFFSGSPTKQQIYAIILAVTVTGRGSMHKGNPHSLGCCSLLWHRKRRPRSP